jgi:hypothetical protein
VVALEKNGEFVRRLSDEYNKLREEYLKLQERCSAAPERSAADKDAIADALIEAQRAARQIVEKAKFEAFQTADAAQKECAALTEQVKRQKEEAIEDLRVLAARVGTLIRDLGGSPEA